MTRTPTHTATRPSPRSRLCVVAVAVVLVLGLQACGIGDTGHGPAAARPTSPQPTTPQATDTGTGQGPVGPGQEPSVEPGATRVRVASFNLLGASHTRLSRDPVHGPGRARARLALRVLHRHAIDVVGLQELEPVQFRTIARHTRGSWQMYPGMRLGARALANSLAWRSDTWRLVRAEWFAIPYFGGRSRSAPVVILRNRSTGRDVAFVNVHNPATTPRWGDNKRWRAAAVRIELRQTARFRRAGYPVILTGDFNAVTQPFCVLARAGGMRAANGGHARRRCTPSKSSGVDWIFGSGDVRFDDYVRDKTELVERTSDHPIVVATALIPATT